MRAMSGIASLCLALGIVYYIYSAQIRQDSRGQSAMQQIDLVAVKGDLLAIAQSERLFVAANGSYGTLEQLRQSGNLGSFPGLSRRGYTYSADVEGATHFRITAIPQDASRTDLPVLSIDETMQVK